MSQAHTELKARLVRYYTHYNSSNLEKIDEILEAYEYNAEEIFDDLLQVYGPEINIIERDGERKNGKDEREKQLERELIQSAEGRDRLRLADSEVLFRQKLEMIYLEETLKARAVEEDSRRMNQEMDIRRKELDDLRKRLELSNQPKPEPQLPDPLPHQVSREPSLKSNFDIGAVKQELELIESTERRSRLRLADSEVLFRQKLEMIYLEETLKARAVEEDSRRMNQEMDIRRKELDDLRKRLELSNQLKPEPQLPDPLPRQVSREPSLKSNFDNGAAILERELIQSAEARARLRLANAEALFRQRHEMLFIDESMKAHAIEYENSRMSEQLEIRKKELDELRKRLEQSHHPQPGKQLSPDGAYSFGAETDSQYNASGIHESVYNCSVVRWAAGQEGRSIQSVPFGRSDTPLALFDGDISDLGGYHPRAGGRYSSSNPPTNQLFKDLDEPTGLNSDFVAHTGKGRCILEISVNCSPNRCSREVSPSSSVLVRTPYRHSIREYPPTMSITDHSSPSVNTKGGGARHKADAFSSAVDRSRIHQYRRSSFESVPSIYGGNLAEMANKRRDDMPSLGSNPIPIKVTVTTDKYFVNDRDTVSNLGHTNRKPTDNNKIKYADGLYITVPHRTNNNPNNNPNNLISESQPDYRLRKVQPPLYLESSSRQQSLRTPVSEADQNLASSLARPESIFKYSETSERRSVSSSGLYITPDESEHYNYPSTSFKPVAQLDPKSSLFVTVNKRAISTTPRYLQPDREDIRYGGVVGATKEYSPSSRFTYTNSLGAIEGRSNASLSRLPSNSSYLGSTKDGLWGSMSGTLNYNYTSMSDRDKSTHTNNYRSLSIQPTERLFKTRERDCVGNGGLNTIGNINKQQSCSIDVYSSKSPT